MTVVSEPEGLAVHYNMSTTLRIVTWNVNGLRSLIVDDLPSAKFRAGQIKTVITPESNLAHLLKLYQANVLCFQETRCNLETMGRFQIPDWRIYSSSSELTKASRTGNRYSGVSIWVHTDLPEPQSVIRRLPTLPQPEESGDLEGRFIALDFGDWVLWNTYVPNAGTNYTYRTERWDPAITRYLADLRRQGRMVVWVGDLNVAPTPRDVYFGNPLTTPQGKRFLERWGGPKPDNPMYQAQYKVLQDVYWSTPKMQGIGPQAEVGFTKAEREGFQGFLDQGYVDVWRHQNPTTDYDGFSYWSLRIPTHRPNNNGWRIDHVLVDQEHIDKVTDCRNLPLVGTLTKERSGVGKYGSDHGPVGVTLTL
jgi:exodeoxyribonuclease III